MRVALAIIVLLYFAITLSFSLLTPAGEANDELDHVQYIEFIVRHDAIPRISLANGHESHQPPLYYLVGAGWQDLLGIPPFHLSLPLSSHAGRYGLDLVHSYTASQRQDAVRVHELRLLSVLFGLCTVLTTYFIGKLSTSKRQVGLAAALFVAVLPKEALVSSVVTNDSLVIALSSVSLLVLVKWLRLDAIEAKKKQWLSLILGLTTGLAVLTKFNALPLLPVFVLILLGVTLYRDRRLRISLIRDLLLVVIGFFSITGWWFVHNRLLYGQFLATNASNAYLKKWLPALISPVSWFNGQRFLHMVPSSLVRTSWFDGGWNQFVLPGWVNSSIALLATASMGMFAWTMVRTANSKPIMPKAIALALFGAVLAGLLAVLIVAQDTLQAEGRVSYIGLSAFATIVVAGVATLGHSARTRRSALLGSFLVWPLVLMSVDVYVLTHVVYPYRGL